MSSLEGCTTPPFISSVLLDMLIIEGIVNQQEQTRKYFRSAASEWQEKSVERSRSYNVIEGRNRAVIDVISRTPNAKHFLDVGCGTGQLVIAVAQMGLEAEGIDFAEEMIAACEANAIKSNVTARFITGSILNSNFQDESFDIISAQGFLEYISPEQTDEFLRLCSRALRPEGAIVLGSRNRLFNAFSLNEFTRLESEAGVLALLIAEAMALNTSSTLEEARVKLNQLERIDPHPAHHPATGISVETRYQYSPADLSYRLKRFGFEVSNLFPIHFHGLPTSVKDAHPELHNEIALAVAEIGLRNFQLVPFSSSFVIEARRRE